MSRIMKNARGMRCAALSQIVRGTVVRSAANILPMQRSVHNHSHTHTKECEKQCWSCGTRNECCDFFCNACRKIQPINQKNTCTYFEFFHLPQKFDINPKVIEKDFWSLQKQLHPDKYSTKSEEERELSARNSAEINKAYTVLKHPSLRAKYLLELHGVNVLEEDSSTAVDPTLLMEIMEKREEIEECNSIDELHTMEDRNRRAIDECVDKISSAYDGEPQLDIVKEGVIQLQYLLKISLAIDERMDVLERN